MILSTHTHTPDRLKILLNSIKSMPHDSCTSFYLIRITITGLPLLPAVVNFFKGY